MSTLEEIADMVGVSRSTVSRVVNDDPRVSSATRARVWETIEAVGYRPNLSARGLATGRTNLLGVVIPMAFDKVVADPFFPALLRGIATAADARDYFVAMSLADPSFRHHIDEAARQGLFGGVILSAATVDDEMLTRLMALGRPFVSVGRSPNNSTSYVDVDNRAGAAQVTAHLLRLGKRRVATIAGPSYAVAAIDRLAGYRDALERSGVGYDDELVFEGDFTEASGRLGARRLLDRKPDAIVAGSDRMAAGALNELRSAGLRVPDDIALVGFDDIPLAREMEPALTTVRQNPQRLGETAVAVLLDLMSNPEDAPIRIVLPTELVVRASCGARL